jgi:hypothetical protein
MGGSGHEDRRWLPLRQHCLSSGSGSQHGRYLPLHRLPDTDRVGIPREHLAPSETFRLLKGEPNIYIKTAESGAKRAHAFCPNCGTPIYAAAINDPPAYSLRVGAIKQRAELRPTRQIWCRSALPWSMDLNGVEKSTWYAFVGQATVPKEIEQQ